MSMQDMKPDMLSLIDTEFERTFVIPKPDKQILTDPVAAQLEAYNAQELGRFLACFADDVVFQGADGEVLFRGHKQMFRVYKGAFNSPRTKGKAVKTKLKAEVGTRITVGSWVVDHQIVHGISKGAEEVVAIYRVEEGLIRHVTLLR